jgi:type IV pilus assembly protein PilB
MNQRLGELLVRENLINIAQLQEAEGEQRSSGERLGYALTKLGYIEASDLTQFLSQQYGVPSIDLDAWEVEPAVYQLISKENALRHVVVPVNRTGSGLVVAMADPTDLDALEDLKFITRLQIIPGVASEAQILESIDKYYGGQSAGEQQDQLPGYDMEEVLEEFGDVDFDKQEDLGGMDLGADAEEAPIIKLVNMMLLEAIKRDASDIHVEPYEKDFRVRYRIDGVLYEQMRLPLKLRVPVTSRIKIIANLDIAERRLPQDGRIKLKLGRGREMDYRVSVCPTLFGEKTVLRLLDKSNLQLDMTKLGFEVAPLEKFKRNIHRPFGMCLVTGPTGSGKTTTLYSALSELNTPEVNLSTAEDPVEFNLPGINQVQQHEDIGLNFASTLRSFLRQDPDIIMVGEIRDFETGEIAIKAALTGHMVLSTLHTNDAPSTVTRLVNMGIEPFLVTASLNLVVAQRLARRVCSECAAPIEVTAEELIDLGMSKEEVKEGLENDTFIFQRGTGCKRCNDTGYKGRVALYEVLELDDNIRELVLQGASTTELKQAAIEGGMETIRRAGMNKLVEGVTTIDEVLRVSASD